MLLHSVDKPTPALLAKRVNETRCNRLGEYLVAGIETLRGHDSQGKLPGIERPAGERFLTKADRLAALEASMNIDVGRDFLDIAGGFKDRDCRCYVCKIGASLRESLFIVRDCGYDFRSL
jgi:hypothetical protein